MLLTPWLPSWLRGTKTISAGTTLDNTTIGDKVIGRPIPIVIGTAPVDGMPVYGGAQIVTTVTSQTTSYTETVPKAFTPVTIPSALTDWSTTTQVTRYETTYTQTIETYYAVGYLLATNPFGVNYDLIRLEVDGDVVFDAENGIKATVEYRFYDGVHTARDPLIDLYVGTNPGANIGDILLFLPKLPTESPPSVKAVISSAASLSSPDPLPYPWADGLGVNANGSDVVAYDKVDGLIYQYVYAGDAVEGVDMLVVFSVDKKAEAWRVPWGSGYTFPGYLTALHGTGLMIGISFEFSPNYILLMDATTGTEVAAVAIDFGKNDAIAIKVVIDAGHIRAGLWLAYGNYETVHTSADDAHNSSVIAVNTATHGIEVIDLATAIDASSMVCPGRKGAGTASFFGVDWPWGASQVQNNVVVEIIYDGQSVDVVPVFTVPAGYVSDVSYDASSGYLSVAANNGATYLTYVVNPNTGAIIQTVVSPAKLVAPSSYYVSRKFYPRSGFAMFADSVTKDVYTLNLATFTMSVYAEYPWSSAAYGFFDQARGIWFYDEELDLGGGYENYWVEMRSEGVAIGTISLETEITAIMSLSGYESGDLTFSGLSGIPTYGYLIDSDTTIRAVLSDLAGVYDFTFCDTGDGYLFKKPAKDGGLTLDGTVTYDDMLFAKGGSVRSDDEADIRTLAKLSFDYISHDGGYETGSVSDDRPNQYFPVTVSGREERLGANIVASDVDMQQRVTEKLYQTVSDARSHEFMTGPAFAHFLPGDVIQIPSQNQVFVTQIDEIKLNRNGSVEFSVYDFQSDVSSVVSSVSNTPLTYVNPAPATQYIHLDIPLLSFSDDLAGEGVVQYATLAPRGQEDWAGAVLFDGDTPGDLVREFGVPPLAPLTGVALGVLAAPAEDFVADPDSSVTIQIINGDTGLVADATEAAVLSGTNLAFIGQPGRWEGVGFTTAVDNGDGTLTLSGFAVRGWRGTEVYSGLHAAGDIFVLGSSEWVNSINLATSTYNTTRYYKAVGVGGDLLGGIAAPYLTTGAAEKPYAPVNLAAVIDGSDIDLAWDYRSRLSNWALFDASPDSGEATLAFEVDIMDGSTVLRTLSVSTNAATYLDADITTDFGSMPATLTFRVYQISAVVARGHMATATITL